MKLRKTITVFSIVVGVAMLGVWILQLLTGQATELETEPVRIVLAITADWITAIMLLVTGIGLLRQQKWAIKLAFFSLGMLVYSVVVSAGYFAQSGNQTFVVLFAILFILSVFFLVVNICPRNEN